MTSALPSARGRLPSASPSRVLTDYATQVFRLDATEEGTGGPDAGKHDLLRVITYNRGREHMQPPTTAGATRNASAHRYHWDRMGMWVPEDAAKQQAMNVHPPKSPRAHSSRGSRGASRGGRIPSASVHQSTTMPVAPAPVTDVVAQSDIWARVVLPAVTWLSNWVDWNLTTTCLPDMIEKEHRMAFALATEQVTEALRLQPDRLSACIWRALVALLTHFVSKIEPLQRANANLRDETKAANNRASELTSQLADALAALEKHDEDGKEESEEESEEEDDKDEIIRPEEEPVRPAMVRRQSTRKLLVPREERSAEGQHLRDQLMQVQRQLMIERKAKEHAQEQLKLAKSGRGGGPDGRTLAMKQVRIRRLSDESGESSDDNEGDEVADELYHGIRDGTSPPAKRAPGRSNGNRRNSLDEIEKGMLDRLEADLKEERKRRMFLERLRAQLIMQLGDHYVIACEQSIAEATATPAARSTAGGTSADLSKEQGGATTAAGAATGEGAQSEASQVAAAMLMPGSRPTVNSHTQYEEDDAALAVALQQEEHEEHEERGHDASSTEKQNVFGARKKRESVQGAKADLKETAATIALRMKKSGWTILQVYEDKQKRDAIDELEHRPKQSLSTYLPDFFVLRHGFRDLAAKNLAGFRESVLAATQSGSRKSLIFALLAGFVPLSGDNSRSVMEPPAFTFYMELERKAKRAAGVDSNTSDSTPVWIPIDRAIELMRNEFKYARITDASRWTVEIEGLLRMPDEIHEINKAMKEGSIYDSSATPAPPSVGSMRGELIGSDLPRGVDARIFDGKRAEEKQKILGRREEALVQNKVLRALARRGLNLRELFTMLDADGSGEIDADEFVSGIQDLEGQLSDAQCKRLMQQIDTDFSGTVDFGELTRALQKLDLRVELNDYLLTCLRFFVAEMQRTIQMLRSKFTQAAGEGKGVLAPDGTRALIKGLDPSLTNSIVHKLFGEMVRYEGDKGPGGAAPVKYKRRSSVNMGNAGQAQSVGQAGVMATDISADTFIKVMMANDFNVVTSPALKEMSNSAVSNATAVLAAVNTFAKKLPGLASKRPSISK